MQLRQADDNLLRSEESHAIIIKELAHTIDDLERKLVLTSMECAVSRQDFLERSYSQKLAAQREREVAEAAAAARAQEAAKLQQQWEQQTYAKRASLAAACGALSSAAAPAHGGRGPYDSPPVMVRTEQPPMGARTRVRGWSGYSSADSL
eukprot:11021-Heterococcus_DN1.PRE.1